MTSILGVVISVLITISVARFRDPGSFVLFVLQEMSQWNFFIIFSVKSISCVFYPGAKEEKCRS
ncbi:MAG: hypothetical protein J7L69_01815 [Desulfobulbaceae bacterium]|nr:hypothetical protein [Desulfobulbaceae bacterium]